MNRLALPKHDAPLTIVVRCRTAKGGERTWSAELIGEPYTGMSATSPDGHTAAVGKLIRTVANSFDTADDTIDFVAALFGSNPALTRDQQLARAVDFAARHPKRRHPGVRVRCEEPVRAKAAAAGKGGAR